MRNLTLVDIYRHYVAEGGTIPKSVFKNICSEFNILIMEHVIYEAGSFDMKNNLSTISIRRIKRNYQNPQVNWNESNKYRQELIDANEPLFDAETGEGTKWLIYHDEEWYCRFYWKKSHAKFTNKKGYKFIATRGDQGNKTKLKEHLSENDINYIKYENGSL